MSPFPYRLDRTLIRVSGPDAQSFLQGLLTQDVNHDPQARVVYAGLLSPQGKIVADMFVWSFAGSQSQFVLDVDRARGADLLRRLSMYKLRADVDLEDISAEQTVIVGDTPIAMSAVDPRMPKGELGYRAIAFTAQAPAVDGSAQLRERLIAAGVPDLAVDAEPEEVFALEALFEELYGVDFQKGCFVGQENVSRMKRRATTRRKFCPLAFEGEAPPFGTPIHAGEAELGSVRSGLGRRALALLRLDRALEAAAQGVTLTAGGVSARLDPPAWLILPAADA